MATLFARGRRTVPPFCAGEGQPVLPDFRQLVGSPGARRTRAYREQADRSGRDLQSAAGAPAALCVSWEFATWGPQTTFQPEYDDVVNRRPTGSTSKIPAPRYTCPGSAARRDHPARGREWCLIGAL